MSLFLIILAAGDSKRLKSNTPKPFHIVNNKTLLEHSFDAFNDFNEKSEEGAPGVWVSFKGNVFDITSFVDAHPGGARVGGEGRRGRRRGWGLQARSLAPLIEQIYRCA